MFSSIKLPVARRIVDFAAVLALATFMICFFWRVSYYSGNYPSQPNQQAGRVYPLNNHGYITYLTYQEHRQREILFDAEMYAFTVCSALVLLKKKLRDSDRGAVTRW